MRANESLSPYWRYSSAPLRFALSRRLGKTRNLVNRPVRHQTVNRRRNRPAVCLVSRSPEAKIDSNA